jgi:hypothetical protein
MDWRQRQQSWPIKGISYLFDLQIIRAYNKVLTQTWDLSKQLDNRSVKNCMTRKKIYNLDIQLKG